MPDPGDKAAGVSPDGSDAIGSTWLLKLRGPISAVNDLSGIVVVGDYLFLGADEGHELQILRREKDENAWRLEKKIALGHQGEEADIEAITYGEGHLYVIGSHSLRRRLLKPDLSVKRNRERLLELRHDPSRSRLYRLPFDPRRGKIGRADSIDLRKRLRKDPLLKPFIGIPSKENGIDIEGLAYRDGRLYAGFRGPVLRDNFVPVMSFEFDRPKGYRLVFVCLEGHGIRDLAALDSGFLLIAGPVNDAPGPFRLWWWDGQDQIPGKGRDPSPAVMLGEISTPGGAKAEGLTLLSQQGRRAEILVLYETSTATQAVRMTVELPG